jgi:hypothetical protein
MPTLGLAASALSLALGGCFGLYGHDEFDRYAQRSDTVTMSAGDAARVNANTHTLTPWPSYVGDRRIPMDGSMAADAVEIATGKCDTPDQRDARGRRCGKRAASERPGGRP